MSEKISPNINKAQSLMSQRLGYSKTYIEQGAWQKILENKDVIAEAQGMQHMLLHNGGYVQQDRMILDKRRTLDKAALYSYQGAKLMKLGTDNIVPGLINPDKTKQNYDDKIVSIGYEYGFRPGDVFEWCNTNTYWLIYLQDSTELAYFRGEIRKCTHEISWKDEQGVIYSTHAAIRGPVETKINFIQKSGISFDLPNHSLNILMPATDESIKYFQRYAKFYLADALHPDNRICWRVEARDSISMSGILELTAVEYYSNEAEDDVDSGIVGGLEIAPENPNSNVEEEYIQGKTFIKPKEICEYKCTKNIPSAEWNIDTNLYPIKWEQENDNIIRLKWTATYSGQFVIRYGQYEKTIVVESLF